MVDSLQQRLLGKEKELSASREQMQQAVTAAESKNEETSRLLQEAQLQIGVLGEELAAERKAKLEEVEIDDQADERTAALQARLDETKELLLQESQNLSEAMDALEERKGKHSLMFWNLRFNGQLVADHMDFIHT